MPSVSPSNISGVSGSDLQEAYISIAANGLEQGQTNAVFFVFDDAYNILPYPGSGIGVNTDPAGANVSPVTVTVTLSFDPSSVTSTQLNIDDFNPFLVKNGIRGNEIHLPDYSPTDLADLTVFGTEADDSNPSTGKYYKTASNLPWGIHISESFDYPKEKIEITSAYNFFDDWATSNGISFPDWFQNNSGYRNSSAIY